MDLPKDYHHWVFAEKLSPKQAVISAEEMYHALRVLRLTPRERVGLVDGNGGTAVGRLNEESTSFLVSSYQVQKRRPLSYTLAFGLPSKKASEEIIEKATVLGVDILQPLICDHCDIAWWKRGWEKFVLKARKISQSALKQSHSSFFPELRDPVPLDTFVDESKLLVVAEQGKGKSVCKLKHFPPDTTEVVGIVGPPGGFSSGELNSLPATQTLFVSLGTPRIRTEFAASLLSFGLLQNEAFHNNSDL